VRASLALRLPDPALPELVLCPVPLVWWASGEYVRFIFRPEAARGSRWLPWGRYAPTDPTDFFGETDVYLSVNVFRAWRRADHLTELHAFYVDLDTRGHRTLDPADLEQVLAEAWSHLRQAGQPTPNLVVQSGRGWHLYWWMAAVEATSANLAAWRAAARNLVASIGEGDLWKPDIAASCDPARVLRMPGTVHANTGRVVVAYETGAPRYEWDELLSALGDQAPSLLASQGTACRSSPTATGSPSCCGNGKARHQIGAWWARIYWHVVRHARTSWGGRIPDGRRDLVLFLLMVALRHFNGQEAAMSAIVELGKEFTSLGSREIKRYMSTAGTRRYRMRKETVVLRLRELDIPVPDWLLGSAPPRQSREAWLDCHATSRDRPWETLGMSRRTWYRKGKPSI